MTPLLLSRSEDGRIATITLRRPERRNALSAAMLRELIGVLGEIAVDSAVRSVVLRGEGQDLCSGADLDELDSGRRTQAGAGHGALLEEALRCVGECRAPVVAQVHGSALGAGCQLVVACDLAVASHDARLGIPSARLGVVIGLSSIEGLVRGIGPKRAAQMLLAGQVVDGRQAAAWGLVNESVPPDLLAGRASEMAQAVSEGAPLSVGASKRGIQATLVGGARSGTDGRDLEFERMAAAALASADLAEGLLARSQRRPPRFTGA